MKQDSIKRHLILDRPRHTWRWLAVGAAFILIAGLAWYFVHGEDTGPVFQTAEARRGDVVATVSATGTLQPVNRVDVGSELSGTLATIEVDYNDRVARGQVLARLDTDLLQAKLIEARASLQSALAKVQEAGATVTETRLALQRCEDLAPRQMCSASDLDKVRAAFQRAQAAEVMAKAQQAQTEALLAAQETNLKKAVIRAPIGGIVLARNVEKGQTVAASFQTPVLFTLAEDLARMELLVAVDEADIGQVKLGQAADFTVDAYPGRRFSAQVLQIRQAPKTVEGVVTYETVLSVDNTELLLLPGMTATADIVIARLTDVLLVPNAALRFTPPAPAAAPPPSTSFFMPQPPRPAAKPKSKEAGNGQQKVYVLRDGVPAAIPVVLGVSDGKQTQVVQGEVTAGMALLVDTVGNPK